MEKAAGSQREQRWQHVIHPKSWHGGLAFRRPAPIGTLLAEMPGLINVVVIEVAKLGFHALASWAWNDLISSLYVLICPIFSMVFIFFSFSTIQPNRCPKQLNNSFTSLATLYLSHVRERILIILTEEGLGWNGGGNFFKLPFIYTKGNKAKSAK